MAQKCHCIGSCCQVEEKFLAVSVLLFEWNRLEKSFPEKKNDWGLGDEGHGDATDDADVHILKTGIETYEKNKKQVYVIGEDVDIFVLLTALTPDYIDTLMLKKGKGKVKDRFYSSKDLQNSNLVSECVQKKIHSLRSCD
ncbi:hypothetical protein AVEN_4569-1 [Araneus ventricosus]|uniref:Uncharacterized protein n=1 Tax=Araneus ventricosus TaxID=182803 RepID=A0A4Y2W648_ARAVE|nr:hypothetical protein AVEN_4569-1 [Araneus ventricosus]